MRAVRPKSFSRVAFVSSYCLRSIGILKDSDLRNQNGSTMILDARVEFSSGLIQGQMKWRFSFDGDIGVIIT